MLLLIYEAIVIPWTDITTAIPDANYIAIKRQLRKVKERGLIEEVRVTGIRKRLYALTDDGFAYLEKVLGVKLPRVAGATKFSPTLPPKKQRRIVRVGECLPFLMGADIYVLQREKPRLDDLTHAMFSSTGPLGTAGLTATPLEESYDDEDTADDYTPTPASDPWSPYRPVIGSKEDLKSLLDFGIFYSSTEVREYAKTQTFHGDLEGAVDVMGRSRFVGVIFKKNELYIVYNTRSNLMMWYEGVEEKTEMTVRRLFSRYKGYAIHDTRNETGKLPAVVFGETMAMLPALVTGHKAGIDKSVKNNKHPRTYRQVNAKTKIYTEVYFVPEQKAGLEVLAHTVTNSRVERYDAIQGFIERFRPSVSLRKDALQPYGHSSDYFELAYLPIFDIKFIEWLRTSTKRVMVATYPEASTAISKSLGTKIIGGLDFHVNEDGQHDKLNLRRYGNDGRLEK